MITFFIVLFFGLILFFFTMYYIEEKKEQSYQKGKRHGEGFESNRICRLIYRLAPNDQEAKTLCKELRI